MLKILLVDDEREEREGIEYLIKKYQYPLAVGQASNGIKALEYLEQNQADILFTDVKMPLMDGLELAKVVNQRYPEMKIIIFSAYGEFEYAKRALEANAVNYLLKPIELDEFREVMGNLLDMIQKEQKDREERRIESWKNRQNVLYKLFTGAAVSTKDRQRVNEDLFDRNECCRFIHVEFLDYFFEKYEELFLKFVRMYLGEQTVYVNLFPNESFLILKEKKYMEREFLKGKLMKLQRDVRTFAADGMTATVSAVLTHADDIEDTLKQMKKVQRELFSFGENIVWTEDRYSASCYSTDVETIRRQLMMAVEANQTELIQKFADQLVDRLISENMISKIYVQNTFYTIIQAIYDKNPDVPKEKILKSSDIIFYAKNSRDMVRLFQQSIHDMLLLIEEKETDDSEIIHRIKSLVEKEYMRDISLNDIAEQVNLAPAYVSYVFKKETGNTLIKYLTEVRMEKARMLLEEGKLKIVQIARECGYENQSYFNRTFKNYFGVKPKRYKEKQNG